MNEEKRSTPDEESAADRVGGAVRLDGNFAAGILSEVFVPDITRAERCAPTATPSGRSVRCPSTARTWAR
jgi:hypothetical protein